VKIRQLRKKELPEYGKLMRYAFDSTQNNYENIKYPELEMPDDWFYGIFQKKQLVCGATLIDYKIKLRGSTVKMGGVAGVTTRPEFRNKGLVRKIMDQLFLSMYEQDVSVSMLYPFKFSYWEMFGYRLSDESILYQFSLENIRKMNISGRYFIESSKINNDIKSVYSTVTDRFNLMPLRKQFQWNWKKNYGFPFICYNDRHKPTGYLFLNYLKEELFPFPTYIKERGLTILIPELFWLDQKTKKAIFSFLWTHRDQREYAAFSVPTDENVTDLLVEPRIETRVTRPNAMFRVINVQQLLEKIVYPLEKYQFTLRIHELCPWNVGCFRIVTNNGKVEVEKVNRKNADLELDIGTFSQLVAGFRTLNDLTTLGLVTANRSKTELLSSLFPRCSNFVRDFF